MTSILHKLLDTAVYDRDRHQKQRDTSGNQRRSIDTRKRDGHHFRYEAYAHVSEATSGRVCSPESIHPPGSRTPDDDACA